MVTHNIPDGCAGMWLPNGASAVQVKPGGSIEESIVVVFSGQGSLSNEDFMLLKKHWEVGGRKPLVFESIEEAMCLVRQLRS
jgi:hypothetical protein